jgi:hypothetical protein
MLDAYAEAELVAARVGAAKMRAFVLPLKRRAKTMIGQVLVIMALVAAISSATGFGHLPLWVAVVALCVAALLGMRWSTPPKA